eukprot:365603-Chlamydomonas_euryale.AAC.21
MIGDQNHQLCKPALGAAPHARRLSPSHHMGPSHERADKAGRLGATAGRADAPLPLAVRAPRGADDGQVWRGGSHLCAALYTPAVAMLAESGSRVSLARATAVASVGGGGRRPALRLVMQTWDERAMARLSASATSVGGDGRRPALRPVMQAWDERATARLCASATAPLPHDRYPVTVTP